jgi:hypothetical protein
MLSGSMEILRSALNASSLSGDADMSRDTTYRLFKHDASGGNGEDGGEGRPSDTIVREVAAAATRPQWCGYRESSEAIARAFQDALQRELTYDEALVEALSANVEAQFRSLGGPVGWLFHAAAMTASPAWQGKNVLSSADHELGEALLGIRADFYRKMTDDMSAIMAVAMSLVGRRPRRGMDPRQLVALMHSMIDGAVLRRYIEPDVFDTRLIGEAAYGLAMAFSEEGTLSDPRRPESPEAQGIFESLLELAADSWPSGSDRSVQSTALEAGIPPETALLFFPTTADLADSAVWSRVLGGGSLISDTGAGLNPGKGVGTEMAMLWGVLRHIRDVAEELPGAIDILRSEPPSQGIGVRKQLDLEITEVLRCHRPGVDPYVTAVELVDAALSGTSGWPAVKALMRVLEVDVRRARPTTAAGNG